MTKMLDARGLACPAPVLMTKDAVEKDNLNVVEVIVDNEAAKENVCRFLGPRHFSVTTSQEGNDYKISAQRQGNKYLKGSFSKNLIRRRRIPHS